MSAALVTRFAPSPTGHLHAGHAYSAGIAFQRARNGGGCFLLRIEDIDRTRCRPEFEAAILEDLAWLGLRWEQPVRRQSEHFSEYKAARDDLAARGLLYPCFCTRKQVLAELDAMGHAPHGIDGPVYPGTCRALSADERAARIARGDAYALRLDVAKALAALPAGTRLTWTDETAGPQEATAYLLRNRIGDAVLARKETPASYHLCVTLDDARQGVTLVTRGRDLLEATHLHRLLQALFGLSTPAYAHHGLIAEPGGERMAKRKGAASLRERRAAGATPAEIWREVGLDLP